MVDIYSHMLHKKIKKTVFTLNVNKYNPEMTELTYPLIKGYADKIGADFHIISERKFPKYPPEYEIMQIYDLGREMKNDWNIYIDSDTLIHPDFFDVTEFLGKDTVCQNEADSANIRFRYDNYFRRDGRNIGSRNWFTAASDWCLDLWHPPDISYEDALESIFPIQHELNAEVAKNHLLDDYLLSRNIARFGLKFKTVLKVLEEMNDKGKYLWHEYKVSHEFKSSIYERVKETINMLANWEVSDYKGSNIQGWMAYSELIWLYLNAQKMNSIVEVGSFKGKSAHALASGCPGNVYLVDDFSGISLGIPKAQSDVERELRANLSRFKNVQIIKSSSVEAAAHFADNSIDMVFIDGLHDRQSVYNDILAWYPKCKKLFCGHDFELDSVKFGISDADLIPWQEAGKIWSINTTKTQKND